MFAATSLLPVVAPAVYLGTTEFQLLFFPAGMKLDCFSSHGSHACCLQLALCSKLQLDNAMCQPAALSLQGL